MTQILIGTPCYGGTIHVSYLHALMGLRESLGRQGIASVVRTISQESLISRARNTIVAEFLGRPDFTHLLFLDADQGFPENLAERLLAADKPVVGAAYPMKGYDWAAIARAAAEGVPATQLARLGLKYALNLSDEDLPGGGAVVRDGFCRVSKAGTGALLIRREVFDALRARYPELRYRNDIAGYENDWTRDNFWAFFDTLLHPESRRYLSEDYAFCHRWTQGCGGEIWLDLQSVMTHAGSVTYAGAYLESQWVAPEKPAAGSVQGNLLGARARTVTVVPK